MALVNEHFLKLSDNYLFADVAKKVNAYRVLSSSRSTAMAPSMATTFCAKPS